MKENYMNTITIIASIFYLAIIIVPFVIVVGGTLKELSREEVLPENKPKRQEKKTKKGRG